MRKYRVDHRPPEFYRASGVVRVDKRHHQALKELSSATGRPIAALVDEAVERYLQPRMFPESNEKPPEPISGKGE